ncbi:MAG TPA: MraY family glycosyltransferase [Candidatus Dojkabacteria bacterium]|nr:MraY family glycosyltransferase [Candidatus Dojkabacteria bacterium]
MDISIPTSILEKILKIGNVTVLSQYDKYLNYWPIFLFGLILSFFLIPFIGKIALKWGVTYKPRAKRKNREFDNPEKALHDKETPALGGSAITIPLIIGLLIFFRLDPFTTPILISLLILVLGSVLDDVFNLPAKVQLGYQILAAAVIAFSVIDLSNISFFANDFLNLTAYSWSSKLLFLPISFVFPGDLILMLWILLCINSVKWVGGSPGLVESYSLVIFALLFIIGIRTFSLLSSSLSILIVGSLISLLYFAFPPPKIMSGSSGKSVYGFLISVLALISGVKFSTTLMLLALPIVDALYVIAYRYITYKPKNPIELMRINDTSHLHHRLIKLNFSRKQILLIETSISLLIGSFAILSTGALRYFALIFGIAAVIAFIVYINYRAHKKEKVKEESPESRYSY